MRQLSVAIELSGSVINRSIRNRICIPLIDQGLDHVDHALDLLCCLRIPGRRQNIHVCHILAAFSDISGRDLFGINALFDGCLNDLIIDIREVRDVIYFIALVHEVTANRIEYDHGTSITDMNEVIYGRTAHIHGHLIGCYGYEFFFFLRQCIIDFNHFHSYLALRIPGTTRTSGTGSCL